MTKIFTCLQLGIVLGSFFLIASQTIEAASADENQLKAAYLIHLSEFTTWPDEKMQLPSFNICIASSSLLRQPLEEIKGRNVKKIPLNIVYSPTTENLNTCHILYVEEELNVSLFLQQNNSTLTVSSDERFLEAGGMIQYVRKEKKIKMRVNLNKLNASKLKMSSKLLSLMEAF
jgi:YfiR/HmsC-like